MGRQRVVGGRGELRDWRAARSMRRPRWSRARTRASRFASSRPSGVRSTAAADPRGGAASSDIALRPPPRRARGGRARRDGGTRSRATVYPLIREQAFLVKGPSEAKKLHRVTREVLPRGASARASAMEAPRPADVAEEVLASLASPGMAGHLRGVLRAEDAHAPYGALDLDAPPRGALTLTPPRTSRDEALMLAARRGRDRARGRSRSTVAEARPRPRPGSAADPAPFDPYATADSPPSRPLRVRVPRPGSHRDARARARARASLAPPWRHAPARPSRAPRASRTTRGPREGGGRARRARRGRARVARARRRDAPRWTAVGRPPDPNATRPDAPRARFPGRRREGHRSERSKTFEPRFSFENARRRVVLARVPPRDARRASRRPRRAEWGDATEASSDVVRRSPRRAKKRPPRRSLQTRGSSARRRRRRTARRDQAARE